MEHGEENTYGVVAAWLEVSGVGEFGLLDEERWYESKCATTEIRKITHWEEDIEAGIAMTWLGVAMTWLWVAMTWTGAAMTWLGVAMTWLGVAL